ncbi:MAG: hypothetical protein PQJ58_02050 [Spirochaetales bacterium]|nr:hypothetical protein [Spirochaetales bacterium]
MAKKITLTVPDALYSKIDRWRSGFNLSGIFQDAVADAIRKKEEFQERLGEENSLAETISRLKREKEGWERQIAEQAEKAGSLWASRAHYEELILAVSTSSDQLFKLPQIQVQIQEQFQTLFNDTRRQISSIPEVLKMKVQDSWLKGVQNFWDDVRDKL